MADSPVPSPGTTGQKSHAAATRGGSALERYQTVMVGKRSLAALLYYEWCVWLGKLPGALGLALRKVFWPRLFHRCGRGVVFGEGIVLRHPHRICLGDRVVISEGCVLDARTEDLARVISIGDDSILSNHVILSCKGATIEIGRSCGLGSNTTIHATHGDPVSIGDDTFMGSLCYLTGGGNYRMDRLDIPIWQQGMRSMGGTRLDGNIWLGANVCVMGGLTMGSGSVAGTGAVVIRDVESNAIVGGVPARRLGFRQSADIRPDPDDQ